MASHDFNEDIDSYISNRRTGKLPTEKKNKKKDNEEVPKGLNSSNLYILKKPKSFWEKFTGYFSQEDDEEFIAKKENARTKNAQEFEEEYDEMRHEQRKGLVSKMMGSARNVEQEYEDADDLAEAQRHGNMKRKGIFTRILEGIGISFVVNDDMQFGDIGRDKYPSVDKFVEIKEDMKQVATISVDVFKRLPKEEFVKLKNSPEFARFKEILKKYNIVK